MLWWLFLTPFRYAVLAAIAALIIGSRASSVDSSRSIRESNFIEKVDFMFPENFLSRYPHEANPFRLKIFAYLLFNLLVKGYGSVDPSRFWSNYNRADFNRVAVDAVFYEYLTNFANREAKNLVFNPLENIGTKISKLVTNEDIAVHRIGQYIDRLSEAESQTEIIKDAYEILTEAEESPAMSKRQTVECNTHRPVKTSGTPGIDYPNFCNIPKTSFACLGNKIPGIYADFETGCQAFHVCWPRRKDSFLCPIGTIFNQSLLTCDLWHDTGCFISPIANVPTKLRVPKYDGSCESLLTEPLQLHTKYLPVKCKTVDLSLTGRKLKPREDSEASKAGSEMSYEMMKEILEILRKLKSEYNIEIKSSDTSRVHQLEKHEYSIPDLNTEAVEDTTEFTKKLGETDFQPPMDPEYVHHSGKVPSRMKSGFTVTRSSLLQPSIPLEEYIKSPIKQDVPEIVMRSLGLGGTILNEGVIPLAKQVMIDSYRKIESKKR